MLIKIHAVTYDYHDFLRIELWNDGVMIKKLEFGDGELEDNTLSRGFNDCYGIDDMIQAIALGTKIETIQHENLDSFEGCSKT